MRFSTITTRIAALALLATATATGPIAAEGDRRCDCRYDGRSFEQGACLCIVTPSGPRYACCEKVLNNSSWSFKDNRCPVAAAPPAAGNDGTGGAGTEVAARPDDR